MKDYDACFLSPTTYIQGKSSGGVQWCTHDYLNTLSAIGIEYEVLDYNESQTLFRKLVRRIFPHPFKYQVPKSILNSIKNKLKGSQKSLVFLNNTSALTAAPAIRKLLGPMAKIIFLSHGAENTDLVNSLRFHPEKLPRRMRTPSWIGKVILGELQQRKAIDLSVCISEQDLAIEKWLGAPETLFLPRTITNIEFHSRAIYGRIGTVATLNHSPNLQGIEALARELLDIEGLSLRLVGGPESIGMELQNRFKSIKYLGKLSEELLVEEASTWNAFVNPIFCYARGASTKVATALSWGMPLVTTFIGSRGYTWDDKLLPRAETAKDLAMLCYKVGMSETLQWWDNAKKLRNLSPTFTECGVLLERSLTRFESH